MLRWDRKNKKIVRGDGVGADNKKLIKTESGVRLPASFKSGQYDIWKAKQKVYLPRVGDAELTGRNNNRSGDRRWKHTGGTPREQTDKPADGVKRKPGTKSKADPHPSASKGGKTRSSLGKSTAKGGLRNVDQITKERKLKDKRKQRSSQPGKSGGGPKGKGKGKRR